MSVAQEVEAKLLKGLAAAEILLNDEKIQKLVDYVLLIHKWNKVFNVTAIRDPLQMVTLHILDSLSVLQYVGEADASSLLDVGAGAGLPSIPLAICLPELQVHAVDSVQKKETFMRQVKGELNLTNFHVETGRVEHLEIDKFYEGRGFDLIISRAFSEIKLFMQLTKELIGQQGQWLAMKGLLPEAEFEVIKIKPDEVIKLNVPALDAKRHLIVYKNK